MERRIQNSAGLCPGRQCKLQLHACIERGIVDTTTSHHRLLSATKADQQRPTATAEHANESGEFQFILPLVIFIKTILRVRKEPRLTCRREWIHFSSGILVGQNCFWCWLSTIADLKCPLEINSSTADFLCAVLQIRRQYCKQRSDEFSLSCSKCQRTGCTLSPARAMLAKESNAIHTCLSDHKKRSMTALS